MGCYTYFAEHVIVNTKQTLVYSLKSLQHVPEFTISKVTLSYGGSDCGVEKLYSYLHEPLNLLVVLISVGY
jgi:hypothetical protein